MFTLLFMFCAHAFCYANLSFSGASVMVDVSRGSASLTADGQFLATLYWRVRGALSAPLLVGLISTVCLAASAVLIADLLGLAHAVSLAALCGTLTLHISVTAINASMLHMADAYFLALLFAVAGAWLCARHPLGFLPAAGFFAACLGMQQSFFAVAPALLALAGLCAVLRGDAPRKTLLLILRSALSLAAGFAVYLIGAMLFCRRQGADLNAGWQMAYGSGLLDAYLAPLRSMMIEATAYPSLCAFLFGLICALALLGALFCLRGLGAGRIALGAVLLCALPLIIAMPVFAPEGRIASSETYALGMLPVAAIALLDHLYAGLTGRARVLLPRLIAGAFGVTFLSSIVFANQVYLKKTLEYQSTLSVMTRVVDAAEHTEGFNPGYTPVAMIGTLEDSPLAAGHEGFEHLRVLDAAANRFTASTQDQNTWYFWEILGYPLNFVSDVERDALLGSKQVAAMPVFPAEGSTAMIDGTLVIKLSQPSSK